MRIVSWAVVIASLSTLSWMGLSPMMSKLNVSDVDSDYAVGTMLANTARASIEVAQAELEERNCEAPHDGAAGRDAHADPGPKSRRDKSAKPDCKQ